MDGRPLAAVLLPPGPALLDAFAAALDGAGPAVLPLDPGTPAPALRAALTALRPACLVAPDGEHPLPDPVPVPAEVPLVIATSGSTGVPKGVELPVAALRTSAAATAARIGSRPGERWLGCLPPYGVAGAMVLVRALLAGTPPVLHDRFDVAPVAAASPDAAVVSLVPTMLRRLLADPAGRARAAAFRVVLLGGAAAPAGLLADADGAGVPVVRTYGSTETCGGCVYDGRPLDGVRVRLDPDGRVVLGGAMLAAGYRLRPDLSAAAFRRPAQGREYVTGDLGQLDRDGTLTVLGRADDVIVTGGVNVVPQRVADLLEAHPDVAEAYVLGWPDPEWGQRVVAVVVPAAGARPTLAGLRAHVAARADRALTPRELIVVPRLPRLPGGKVDRLTLAALPAVER